MTPTRTTPRVLFNPPLPNSTGPSPGPGNDAEVSNTLADLEAVLRSRRDKHPDGSYSASLFADRERLLRKIMEEAFEVCLELGRPEPNSTRVAEEAADLVFHLLAGLVSVDVPANDVERVLERRRR